MTTITMEFEEITDEMKVGTGNIEEVEEREVIAPEPGGEVTFDGKDLKAALVQLKRTVSTRSTLPILGHLYMRMVAGRLQLVTTNLEQSTTVSIHAFGELAACIPFSVISKSS
jgi:hypothetical protein